MANHVECFLCAHFLWIYPPSEVSLHVFCPFSIWIVSFFYCWFLEFIIYSLYKVCIFLIFLTDSFAQHKFFILTKSNLLTPPLCCLWSLKILCLFSGLKDFLLLCSPHILWFLHFKLKFMINFEYILCTVGFRWVSSSSPPALPVSFPLLPPSSTTSPCQCPVAPAKFVEKSDQQKVLLFHRYQKPCGHICMGLFLGLLFLFLICGLSIFQYTLPWLL